MQSKQVEKDQERLETRVVAAENAAVTRVRIVAAKKACRVEDERSMEEVCDCEIQQEVPAQNRGMKGKRQGSLGRVSSEDER